MPLSTASIAVGGVSAFAAGAAVACLVMIAALPAAAPAAVSQFAMCTPSAQANFPDEAPYLAENDAAMNKMTSGMAAQPTGDIDRDFVSMMTPHHQGAIEMAEAILRYGHNEQLRRLAQEIIVTQQQEIATMRLAIGATPPPSVPSPTQITASTASHSAAMSVSTILQK